MVNRCLEQDRWWGVGVVAWECERQLEGQLGVGGVFWAFDRGAPGEEVAIGGWEGGNAGGGGGHELHEFGLESGYG